MNKIYDRTNGNCHICYKRLSFVNYTNYGAKGAWEIEHSIPKVDGGTDRLNNLYAACISCNRSKGKKSTRSVRAKKGHSRAPYSKAKMREIRRGNKVVGAVIGGVVGSILGLGGTIIGAGIGATIANDSTPKK